MLLVSYSQSIQVLTHGCRNFRKQSYEYRWQQNDEHDATNSEVESRFWSGLGNGSPLYGADVEGSCFDKGIPWNLSEIKSTLIYGLQG